MFIDVNEWALLYYNTKNVSGDSLPLKCQNAFSSHHKQKLF